MKVITYGIQPKPKPLPNLPLMLADEIMRRHSGWVLVEACKIIAQRLVPEVPQSDTSTPAANTELVETGSKLVVEAPTRRRPGRPKGTRKRRPGRPRKVKPWDNVKAATAAKMNSSVVAALTQAIGGKPAFSQDSESENGNGIIAGAP